MEKWARNLSKSTALIIGIVSLIVVGVIVLVIYQNVSGFLPIIILGALMGGGIGFAFPLIIKGITGQTPLEKKEAQNKNG